MLTREQIIRAVHKAAAEYPVQSVYLFGSYADGTATESSDVDFYVTFKESPISFFKVMGFRAMLEDMLQKDVDIVKRRPAAEADTMVSIYEA